jgi:eukaryotic-like serine/threonine-protein kinase
MSSHGPARVAPESSQALAECAETLLPPERRPRLRTTDVGALPDDVIRQSAQRLRLLALVYATVFFVAGFVGPLLFHVTRFSLGANPLHWMLGAVAVTVALAVAILIQLERIPLTATAATALVFEVVGSYGIVAAEFTNPMRAGTPGFIGFSSVAVWTLLFTMVVPTPPRRAALAALASVSSVPVGMALLTATGLPTATSLVGPVEFFFSHVFPYLVVVVMAYVGARVVYGLGTEVRRARELGSYRLVERLGQGGMGEVWRAEHRLLARPAAIKLIRPSFTTNGGSMVTAAAMRRFEREAQVTAQLRSPHTIDLFDFGIADDGRFYYVMELLEGIDVETLVRRFGPIPPERAIFLLGQICHSLSEAESCGLVHRDIKPANIFLCRYGEDYDFVKVLDFGIVKAVNSRADTGPLVTLEPIVQGTLAYIAPEQALGLDVDSRTDIYAIGCVAYWLLTGETVFTADTPFALLTHHVQSAPVPPSARSELPIPTELDGLVLSCLEKRPANRPPSAKDLGRRLDALHVPSPWNVERARDWWGNHDV